MTTSNTMSLSSVTSLEDKRIPAFEIGYLKATAQDGAYESFLEAFLKEQSRDPAITKAFIARRSGKGPEQITRYLGSPGNWTLDTYAVLCAAIGYKPVFGVEKIPDMRQGNARHPLANTCSVADPAVAASIQTYNTYGDNGQPSNLLDRTNDGAGQGLNPFANVQQVGRPSTPFQGVTTTDVLLGPKNAIESLDTKVSTHNGFRTGLGA